MAMLDNEAVKAFVEADRQRRKDFEEQEKAQQEQIELEKEYLKIIEDAYAEDRARTSLFKRMADSLSGIFKLQKDESLSEKRSLGGAGKLKSAEKGPAPEVVKIEKAEGMLGAILGGIAGFISGFLKELTNAYKLIVQGLMKAPKKIFNIFEVVYEVMRGAVKTITGAVKFFLKPFTLLLDEMVAAKIFEPVVNFFNGFKNLFKSGAVATEARFVELLSGIKNIVNAVLKPFKSFVTTFFGEASYLRTEMKGIRDNFKLVVNMFRNIGETFGRLGGAIVESEIVRKAVNGILKTFETMRTYITRVQSYFGEIASLFRRVSNGMKLASEGATSGTKFITRIVETVSRFSSGMKSMFNVLKPLGEIFGKLFVPLIVIYETVTNFFKVFTDESNEAKSFGEKFLEGLKGTLVGIIDELLLIPLDLVKSMISWVAGKLGFENVEQALDSFSFEKMFHGLVDNFWQIFEDIGFWLEDQFDSFMDNPLKYLGDLANSLAETVTNAMTGIFSAIKNALIGVLNLIPGVNIGKTDEEVQKEEEEKKKAKAEKKEARKREKLDRAEKKQIQKELKSSGVVKSAGLMQGYKIDDEQLASMSDEELDRVARGFSADKNIQLQVDQELDRRAVALEPATVAQKEGSPSMTEVLNPSPTTPQIVSQTPVSVVQPQVVGTAQDVESLSREMTDYQRILNDNRSVMNNSTSSGVANVGVDASNTTINNSTTIRSAAMAEPHDVTDRMGYMGYGVPYRR